LVKGALPTFKREREGRERAEGKGREEGERKRTGGTAPSQISGSALV